MVQKSIHKNVGYWLHRVAVIETRIITHTWPQLIPNKIYRCQHVGLMRIDGKWKSWVESIRRHLSHSSSRLPFWISHAISLMDAINISRFPRYHSSIFARLSFVLHFRHFPDTCAFCPHYIRSTNIQLISIPSNILRETLSILSIKEKSIQIL